MKKPNKPTGGKRLKLLIDKGLPLAGGVWLDTYNGIYNTKFSGTIKSRIDGNCMYFLDDGSKNPLEHRVYQTWGKIATAITVAYHPWIAMPIEI